MIGKAKPVGNFLELILEERTIYDKSDESSHPIINNPDILSEEEITQIIKDEYINDPNPLHKDITNIDKYRLKHKDD